jgi:transcriptional regulator, propionate catabolism operon regulatory protein
MVHPTPPSARPRLCFLSYRHIRQFALPAVAEFAGRADIEMVDGTFAGALALAQDRVERGLVDAFVSAGSNASILRAGLTAPVATIQLSGFDLLQALIKARGIANRVGIVMYGQTIPELDAVKDLLKIEINQYAYRTPDDARQRFEQLQRDGFKVIVGSSLVVELAEQHGLHGLLAYSLSSIRRGIEDAIELARVARLEASRYDQLNGVLHNLQEAVLAVNRDHRIIAVNPPMQALLGLPEAQLVGQPLDNIDPALSLRATLRTGLAQRDAVEPYAQRDWVVHRTPIREHGEIVGAAITLYDAQDIQAAETRLRVRQRRHQGTARHTFDSLIGASPVFERLVQRARRFAGTDLTVLLAGESGSGKELFAQAIHNESRRREQAFVAVNCASFPETLLESELFGYDEGAFTGARRGGKRGLFEAAHGGTLFLDEIGDMPMPLQSRLLRVLQEREVTRLGASVAIPVDVRVIVATHQPLAEMVRQKRFRQDLYYRITTLCLSLPALRDRRDDIAALAMVLLRRSLQRLGAQIDCAQALAPMLPTLLAYGWPGNVRELENICERMAVVFAQSTQVADIVYTELQHECPELFDHEGSELAAVDVDAAPKERLAQALHLSRGNRQRAADLLGVSRSTLWRWIRDEAR